MKTSNILAVCQLSSSNQHYHSLESHHLITPSPFFPSCSILQKAARGVSSVKKKRAQLNESAFYPGLFLCLSFISWTIFSIFQIDEKMDDLKMDRENSANFFDIVKLTKERANEKKNEEFTHKIDRKVSIQIVFYCHN